MRPIAKVQALNRLVILHVCLLNSLYLVPFGVVVSLPRHLAGDVVAVQSRLPNKLIN